MTNSDLGRNHPRTLVLVGDPEQEGGSQEALSRQRGRGVHNLSAQRREQRIVCSRASVALRTAR